MLFRSNARLIGSGEAQARNADDSPASSHPAWEPHVIQGWTPDFIPKVLQESIDNNGFDEVLPVDGNLGMQWAARLAAEEGILTGVSGGSTLATAIEVAESAPEGSVILAMLPDTGERYLSTPLFDDISEQMNEEEMALSDSTPLCRFAPQPSNTDKPAQTAPDTDELDADTETWVNELLAREPVVMFALEWCEFCWSVRKLFKALELDYTSIDLDSVA